MKPSISIIFLTLLLACQQTKESTQSTQQSDSTTMEGTFGHDRAFLKDHQEILLLQAPDNPQAQAIVIADYQGRVMTSTARGDSGTSYGWINYELIRSGQHQPHINAFGGEDRFWLSPEGGQFSVYFAPGKPFDFENWQTPALIDTEAFETVEAGTSSATFRKKASLQNHSGTRFELGITRKVTLLSQPHMAQLLGLPSLDGVQAVAYESENTLTNHGADWQKETGLLGVWILGMFQPSPATTIVAPFTKNKNAELGLTANYFGEVPADRLVVGETAVFLKADGKYRSKIGLAPQSARPVAGSYDAEKRILTLIQYDLDPQGDYLKSTWEQHKDPFRGDALNSYNDGPLEDGGQMGPFYELESSSAAKPLKKGESLTHRHRTFHFEGDAQVLSSIARQVLGVELETIQKVFQ
ncbi:hypothetical protein GCM10027275_33140 [Rhabdobacter roseus]|uniref:Lipoprotein n=1 Tax=Rhabdobacter roseus TaxID=1655419 RepID=A0A840TQ53_9BACT|nr:DUF6786 family protein [Rhabdobacter roseus]MBB5285464.1 hypothetical protein [Rhabdobacter roseus]